MNISLCVLFCGGKKMHFNALKAPIPWPMNTRVYLYLHLHVHLLQYLCICIWVSGSWCIWWVCVCATDRCESVGCSLLTLRQVIITVHWFSIFNFQCISLFAVSCLPSTRCLQHPHCMVFFFRLFFLKWLNLRQWQLQLQLQQISVLQIHSHA